MSEFPKMVKIADLNLADVVELFEGPYGTGTVTKINEGLVTINRPYGATADFACGGSVIFYTGMETCNYLIQSSTSLKVWQRSKDLK